MNDIRLYMLPDGIIHVEMHEWIWYWSTSSQQWLRWIISADRKLNEQKCLREITKFEFMVLTGHDFDATLKNDILNPKGVNRV